MAVWVLPHGAGVGPPTARRRRSRALSHPSPRRTLRPLDVRPSSPPHPIISATLAPIAIPRFSTAVPASTNAILTLLPRSTRRRAAASSRARPASAAASAASAGPLPCRSCAVVLLPPRRVGVAAAAASLRSVLSPAISRLLRPPLAFACTHDCVGVRSAIACPTLPSAASPVLVALATSLKPCPSCCRCSSTPPCCRRPPRPSHLGAAAPPSPSCASTLCTVSVPAPCLVPPPPLWSPALPACRELLPSPFTLPCRRCIRPVAPSGVVGATSSISCPSACCSCLLPARRPPPPPPLPLPSLPAHCAAVPLVPAAPTPPPSAPTVASPRPPLALC